MFDINSRGTYPCNVLSNLYNNPFVMDQIEFGSIEGFLQGLREPNPDKQLEIFKMHGIQAKRTGRGIPIKDQTLYYRGEPFNRHSEKYQSLLNTAYFLMCGQNFLFRKALMYTEGHELTHVIGKTDPFDTILTNDEFISRLYSLRKLLCKNQ
ncbi:gp30.3 conserved hypothetical protein [Acinetobacter phage Ac42]|uniref:gp30.3 conserved hypothetical protein n=1 Tax=Acinetobacter phage Ac42 TaxID=762660 RepID=UPI0001EBCDF7|nr:gp30.3 conserved hypothetical protein [Acinetobacter phage Ac42]ADI96443.1 gp30.3 conserved hypothetical protein [Acinetobacter phage Ac42]